VYVAQQHDISPRGFQLVPRKNSYNFPKRQTVKVNLSSL